MAKAKTKTVRVTLKKSTIGQKPKNRATVEGLGLRKINQTVEHVDSPSLRGMLNKVSHLVEVQVGDAPEEIK
ncbi:MAG: 50S ribosomal protein L30 [Acidimicrobiia bacterium]